MTRALLATCIFFWAMYLRFVIFFMPFRVYRNLLGKSGFTPPFRSDRDALLEALRISRLVESVCNKTPWESKCLVQAIICKQLLRRRGINTALYLGVCRSDDITKLDAHAWVKLGEHVLTGAKGYHRFNVINVYG